MTVMHDFAAPAHEPHEAWVVFSTEADLWWLKILKPGFRHCFVIARSDQHWLVLDPLSPYLECAVLPLAVAFDLPHWLRQQNMTVIAAPLQRHHRHPAPFAPYSCVEVVKRFLGLHARHVVTPWQLYRFLTKENSHGKTRLATKNAAPLHTANYRTNGTPAQHAHA